MEIRGWSLCSGEDGQFKLELGDHFDRNLQLDKLLLILRTMQKKLRPKHRRNLIKQWISGIKTLAVID
jgi:hypothetical protein